MILVIHSNLGNLGLRQRRVQVVARTPVAPTALHNSERRESRTAPCSGSLNIDHSFSRGPRAPGIARQMRDAGRPNLITLGTR